MTRRRVLGGLLGIAILCLLMLALRSAGAWLVVEDPPQKADAIVVFGGQVPFRAMEAAALFAQGWAPAVWLTPGDVSDEDAALADLNIQRPTEADYSRRVLERLGVPAAAIHKLPESTLNTADEVRAVAREIERIGGTRVVIVSSRYHTRRVKVLWAKLVGRYPKAIVRYASKDPFDADRWWRSTPDALSVTREWVGLLNAWIGFPVGSSRIVRSH